MDEPGVVAHVDFLLVPVCACVHVFGLIWLQVRGCLCSARSRPSRLVPMVPVPVMSEVALVPISSVTSACRY